MWLPKHKIKGENKKINNNHLQKKKKYIKDQLNLNDVIYSCYGNIAIVTYFRQITVK